MQQQADNAADQGSIHPDKLQVGTDAQLNLADISIGFPLLHRAGNMSGDGSSQPIPVVQYQRFEVFIQRLFQLPVLRQGIAKTGYCCRDFRCHF